MGKINSKHFKSTLSGRAGQPAHCPDFADIVQRSTPDTSLFEQIADCFSDQLEAYAKYVCRDATSGEDAFQDAMIAAMRHLETYRGDSPIDAWLRRIVVNACSHLKRGKKNDPATNLPLDHVTNESELPDPTPDQELQLIVAERLELVYAEIEKLEEPNRSLLKLHDVEEVRVGDLAGRFGMSEDAVKSRLKRARARVRENLLK